MTELNISNEIKHTLKRQRKPLTWLSNNSGIHYKTLWDRLNRDGFDGVYDFLTVAKLLNIDLNELRDRI
jgi:hypothetical protein